MQLFFLLLYYKSDQITRNNPCDYSVPDSCMIVVVTGGANKPLLSINNVCSAFMQPGEYVHFTAVKTITDKQFNKTGSSAAAA